MRARKHLPLHQWPASDHAAFERVYRPGDIFDDARGSGAHLATGTRHMIQVAYRRWLSFLCDTDPAALLVVPPQRVTPAHVRAFVELLTLEVSATSVAIAIENLLYAARLFSPEENWEWLRSLGRRLRAQARPEDRFNRLVPGWQTVDLGMRMMDDALMLSSTHRKARELRYRDGLIVALLSCWLIRRRSVAALTVRGHVECNDSDIFLLLHDADTKSKRPESFKVPDQLASYFRHYLGQVRPRLLRSRDQDGLWISYRGRNLLEGRIYDIVRRETAKEFGKAMCIHDFRRAGATFLAMEFPTKVGLIPGMLQHASPEVSEQHYNLARAVEANRRYATHIAEMRDRLRPQRFRRGLNDADIRLLALAESEIGAFEKVNYLMGKPVVPTKMSSGKPALREDWVRQRMTREFP